MSSQNSSPFNVAAVALNHVAVLGSAVLAFGWYFAIPVLIQQYGPYADIHFDTVVCLVLISLASIFPVRWGLASFILIGMVALSALLTLLGYTMRFEQPIDFLLEDVGLISARHSVTLHMPFTTALSLLLVCYGLVIMQLRASSALSNTFALASAAVGALVMLQDLLSQKFLKPEPDFAGTHDVALQTSVLILILSVALCLRASVRLIPVGYRRLDHYYAWSTVLLIASFLIAWEYQERIDWSQRAFETDVALKTESNSVEGQIKLIGHTIQRLGARWSTYGTPTQAEWESDARAMLQISPAIYAIAYVDMDRTVRWRVAQSGNEQDFVGVRLDNDPVRKMAFDTVDRLKTMQMTQTVQLGDGQMVRLYLTPVFNGSVMEGYLLAALRLNDLPSLITPGAGQDYNIQIFDGVTEHNLLHQDSTIGEKVRRSDHFETFGQYWTVTAWPTDRYIADHRSRLLLPTLLFGGLMTFLVAAAFSQTRQSQISLRREGEAKAALATTLDQIGDGFVTVGRDWRVTYANTRAPLILGRGAESLVGRHVVDLMSDPAALSTDSPLTYAMKGKGIQRVVAQNRATGRWLDVTSYPTNDGIALLFRDVTHDRERDEFLRLLETAVSRQNDVLIITDTVTEVGEPTERIVYVNDAFVRLSGYSRDEAIGQTPRMLQGRNTGRMELDKIRQALDDRRPIQIELINYAKNGDEYWVELDIAPIFDPEGNCTHFVGVERDITERKRIEALADYNLERFQHIFDVTNDIIWDVDLATDHVQYNENLKKTLGYDPAIRPLTGDDFESWVHPDDLPTVTKVIAEAIAMPMPPVDMEYRIRRSDGTYAIFTDRAKIIRDAEGKPIRIVGTMSDVTERRAMADRLRQAQQLEAVGQLTGGVAHDFNNLLTVILGNSELLADRLAAQPKLQKLAEMTVTMALRGSELTSRLLAFARRQPLEPKRIEVNALVDSMEEWMRRTLPATISLNIKGAADLWQIEADPNQLENALLNLAVNARDAMPQGGQLVIETANGEIDEDFTKQVPEARPGKYVRISVQDSGTGMDAGTLTRAFEPFFTTKAMGKGSGLGLSMVYGFVRQSAGFAYIDSSLGHGTTVHLYFPCATEGTKPRKIQPDAEKIVGGTEHILAVEDEESVLENVVAKLEGLGYRVSFASAGSTALEIIAKDPTIDLLFTDIVMPGDLSGPELVKRAEEIRPGLKVLYTSGYTDDTIMHDGKMDAGLTLLAKPYRLADLAEKVRMVLDA